MNRWIYKDVLPLLVHKRWHGFVVSFYSCNMNFSLSGSIKFYSILSYNISFFDPSLVQCPGWSNPKKHIWRSSAAVWIGVDGRSAPLWWTYSEEVGAPLGLLAHRCGCVGGLRHVDAQLLLAGAGRGRHRRRVVAQAAGPDATATAVARLEARGRENIVEIYGENRN